MKWVMPPRTMEELWEAAEGACQWRGPYWGFMGLHVHSGAGWQAIAMGADEWMGRGRYIEGHERTPKAALVAFLREMEDAPRIGRYHYESDPLAEWLAVENKWRGAA